MSLIEKIKVGDVLTHNAWGGNSYLVTAIIGDEVHIKNINNTWEGWLRFKDISGGVQINGIASAEYFVGVEGKTPVERKIAFMRQRWEKRNEPQPTW